MLILYKTKDSNILFMENYHKKLRIRVSAAALCYYVDTIVFPTISA